MSFEEVYFSLGSNLGDREENIRKALSLMSEVPLWSVVKLSHIIETLPMGFSGNKFLNCVVLYKVPVTDGTPEEEAEKVLRRVKAIEREMGRNDFPEYDDKGKRIYHSRVIDIDILFFGLERIETPDLIIPHKGIKDRQFVMIPLSEIASPELREGFPDIF